MLVTGGAGYIGSHCCKVLAANGYRPIVFDNLSAGHPLAVKWGPFEKGDVRDRLALVKLMGRYRPKAVFHIAASAYVSESISDPETYYDNNVGGMISLLGACREAGVDRIVFSSSCATYGVPANLPITESAVQVPINPYGRTKLACELMLRDYAEAYRLRYVGLRYFNAAGADPDGELGEWHVPETHVIPRAIMAALGTAPPLEIFGSQYPTSDGTCVRDFVHVTDLAQAHLNALFHLERGGENLFANLGSGTGYSVAEIISMIEKVGGRKVPFRMSGGRAGDPPALIADSKLAERILRFMPVHSSLETIVRTAMAALSKPMPSMSSNEGEGAA